MPVIQSTVKQPVFQGIGGFEVTPSNDDLLIEDSANTKGYDRATLYVGGEGDVKVMLSSGEEITFVGVAAGTFMPVVVKQVFATGTSATDIVALV